MVATISDSGWMLDYSDDLLCCVRRTRILLISFFLSQSICVCVCVCGRHVPIAPSHDACSLAKWKQLGYGDEAVVVAGPVAAQLACMQAVVPP